MTKNKLRFKNKRDTPTEICDYKLRITKFKSKTKKVNAGSPHRIRSQNSSFMNVGLSTFPSLPIPSSPLRELLLQFNSLNDVTNKTKQNHGETKSNKEVKGDDRLTSKKQKKHNINGFIAYRTFYSKFVFNPDHQKQLSSLLAKLWYDEPSKDIWKTYACGYNDCNQAQGFFEWLCANLKIDLKQLNALQPKYNNFSRDAPYANISDRIEDVYIQSTP